MKFIILQKLDDNITSSRAARYSLCLSVYLCVCVCVCAICGMNTCQWKKYYENWIPHRTSEENSPSQGHIRDLCICEFTDLTNNVRINLNLCLEESNHVVIYISAVLIH